MTATQERRLAAAELAAARPRRRGAGLSNEEVELRLGRLSKSFASDEEFAAWMREEGYGGSDADMAELITLARAIAERMDERGFNPFSMPRTGPRW